MVLMRWVGWNFNEYYWAYGNTSLWEGLRQKITTETRRTRRDLRVFV
ncbi:hypothetical protein CKA32_003437 [Geitlerinema sp. FC II]|nr:hypothetical protein CKA32_003437 [Geitlerinema sp. FC II]